MPALPSLLSITFLALLFRTTSAANADVKEPEPATTPAWTVQVDPLTTVLGIAHVLVERRVSDNVAIYAGPSLKLYDNLLSDDEGYRALGVEFGARWFFSGSAPAGWWAGGRATVASVSHDDESRVGGYISALGGYAWIFDDRWVVSGALGVSYFDYSAGGVGVDGVLPGAHTAVGFAF